MEDNTSTAVADPILDALSDETTATDDSNIEETETKPQDTEDTDTESTEDDSTDESESEAESEAEQPTKDQEEAQPIDPKEEARRRYEERQAFREEQRAKVANETKDYIDNADSETEQRLRNIEVRDYQALIENTQDKLVNEFERVKANPDLQVFNPESPEFNQAIYNKAIRDFNAGYVTYDSNQNMVGVKSSLFNHLTETAELLKEVRKSGAIQQVRAGNRMRSTADPKPAAPPKDAPKDTILDILKSD